MNRSITTSFTSLVLLTLTAFSAVAQTIDIHIECAANVSCVELPLDKSRFGDVRLQSTPILKITEDDVIAATISPKESTIGGLIVLRYTVTDKFEAVERAHKDSKVAIVVAGEVTDLDRVPMIMMGKSLVFSKESKLPERAAWVPKKVFGAAPPAEIIKESLKDDLKTKAIMFAIFFPIALIGFFFLRRRRKS